MKRRFSPERVHHYPNGLWRAITAEKPFEPNPFPRVGAIGRTRREAVRNWRIAYFILTFKSRRGEPSLVWSLLALALLGATVWGLA